MPERTLCCRAQGGHGDRCDRTDPSRTRISERGPPPAQDRVAHGVGVRWAQSCNTSRLRRMVQRPQLHPEHRRRGRDPPRPRHHRAGHRRAEERPPGARPLGEVRRQRCLAHPGLPRVQRLANRRRRRLATRKPGGPPCGHTWSPSRPGSRPQPVGSYCTCPRTRPRRPRGTTSGPPPRQPDHPGRIGPEDRPTCKSRTDRLLPAAPAANDDKSRLRTSPPTPAITFGGSGLREHRTASEWVSDAHRLTSSFRHASNVRLTVG